jgi:hypothetical protein
MINNYDYLTIIADPFNMKLTGIIDVLRSIFGFNICSKSISPDSNPIFCAGIFRKDKLLKKHGLFVFVPE